MKTNRPSKATSKHSFKFSKKPVARKRSSASPSLLFKLLQNKRLPLFAFISSFAAVGSYFLISSFANTPYRAFSPQSYWNTPLPANAPRHPNSDNIIAFLKTDNVSSGCPLLSSTGTNDWGMPFYWAKTGDTNYIVNTTKYAVPPEFTNPGIRIPAGAKPMPTSDGEMVVFDQERGYVVQIWQAVYNATTDTWSSSGGSITYLGSNGIDGRFPESDDTRNKSAFRGYPGSVTAARYDMVMADSLNHVIKVGVNTANSSYQFPMWGSDGSTTNVNAPIQGARIRIRPDVDLTKYNLHPQALPIAKALQKYGMMVGDSTGAPVELKLENTRAEGRGQLWEIANNALCSIPLDLYEVIDYGYFPPPETITTTDTTAPSAPTAPTASTKSASQIDLSWTASTDNVGVTGYDVYRNNTKLSTVATTSYSDTGLSASTTYSYHVIARDAAGNSSPASNTVTATTQSTPPPPTADTTAPTVSISSPANGSTIGRSTAIKATATDNMAVTKMEVYADGNLKATSTSGSISYTWNTKRLVSGAHTITVKAYDAAGNIGQSSLTVYK